jgi:hypothetical protein
MVTWDGKPFRKGFSGAVGKKEADAFAERWQGTRYKSGMLKGGDKLDYFEVKRDHEAEKELKERMYQLKVGNPQKVTTQQYVED